MARPSPPAAKPSLPKPRPQRPKPQQPARPSRPPKPPPRPSRPPKPKRPPKPPPRPKQPARPAHATPGGHSEHLPGRGPVAAAKQHAQTGAAARTKARVKARNERGHAGKPHRPAHPPHKPGRPAHPHHPQPATAVAAIELAGRPGQQRWNVTASAESMGGIGSCGHEIRAHGYSELSTDPTARNLDFNALGNLPCGTVLNICNPANGRVVQAAKQDIGAGSSFLPVMGLYPGTREQLGLTGGEFHVQIWRADGKPLHPASGTLVQGSAPGATGPASGKLYNPLEYADVVPGRVDQGVDYGVRGGYLVAVADGKVGLVSNTAWQPYGNYLCYEITQPGPLRGVVVYYAEGVKPVVKTGELVRGGARVANLVPGWHYGIEIGYAANTTDGRTWAYEHGGWTRAEDGNNDSTRAGVAFNRLIVALGGPGGIVGRTEIGDWPPWTNQAATAGRENAGRPVNPIPANVLTLGSANGIVTADDYSGQVDSIWKGLDHAAHVAWVRSQSLHSRISKLSVVTAKKG